MNFKKNFLETFSDEPQNQIFVPANFLLFKLKFHSFFRNFLIFLAEILFYFFLSAMPLTWCGRKQIINIAKHLYQLTNLSTDWTLLLCPSAPAVCEPDGGSVSGCGGAPPGGHRGSAPRSCPAEEVCHLNSDQVIRITVMSPVYWRCFDKMKTENQPSACALIYQSTVA